MSKKKRRRQRRRANPPLSARDRHHICFQHRYWDYGYAKLIRDHFVRPVPVVYHRELHNLLHDVPLPDGALLKDAWMKYLKEQDEVDGYGISRAIAWLYVNIPDANFRRAMQVQLDFFVERLGGSA